MKFCEVMHAVHDITVSLNCHLKSEFHMRFTKSDRSTLVLFLIPLLYLCVL